SPGARNVIAGYVLAAIGGYADFTVIQGNYLGTDATGTAGLIPWMAAIGTGGVEIDGGGGNLIGGGPGQGNVILGRNAVIIQNSDNNQLSGNIIGADVQGRELPGYRPYIAVFLFGQANGNVVGGTEPGTGNLIANYDQAGGGRRPVLPGGSRSH